MNHQTTFLDDFRRNIEAMHRELALNPNANQEAWEEELKQLAKLCAQEQREKSSAAAASSSGVSPVLKQP